MRRRAFELIARTDDDLSDAELFMRQALDDYWYIDLCLETLHRLPSELDATLTMREYGRLQAHATIKRAISDMQRTFR